MGPLRTHFSDNFNQNTKCFIHENASENIVCKIAAILSQPRCVKPHFTEAGIFQENLVNTVTADALALLVTHQAALVLTLYIDGLVQERRNSIANALELRLSCTNPSM